LFESFVDLYCPSVFSVVARLTTLSDEEELEDITSEVLVELWEKKQELIAERRPGVFIYKVVLRHIFSYLNGKGNEERVRLLEELLPIDPVHYR
jgi:DNA-directed RNA polymerase specialized sigma24 family protein